MDYIILDMSICRLGLELGLKFGGQMPQPGVKALDAVLGGELEGEVRHVDGEDVPELLELLPLPVHEAILWEAGLGRLETELHPVGLLASVVWGVYAAHPKAGGQALVVGGDVAAAHKG